jgi:outer membrane protein assembly factor BamB
MIGDFVRRAFKLPRLGADLSQEPQPPFSKRLALDPESPWPKFRCNAIQDGRSSVQGAASGLRPWEFQTGKGVFSSPVIDACGTVYIGSADHHFYAITEQGELKWRFATRGVIDSSGLLDDQGCIYFGSGDGLVYCLNRETGHKIWTFASHSPREVERLYGIKTFNVNWFEGNMALAGDGTLLAPNDNYLVYGLNRESGKVRTVFPGNEMIWSCPAVNPATDRIFFSTCFAAVVNTFCFQAGTGKKHWTSGGLGSVSASPMLTSEKHEGGIVVGGFDGIVRALSQVNGKQLWAFGTRDHIYGSPARQSRGIIIQASCDGTVYGLDARTGRPVWTFDTPEPIRSSSAVDAADRIYFGSGNGRLYCLNPDGTFRWAFQCIRGDRNDLNSSPALGKKGVCIAGENGKVFFIPYDYPLTREGAGDGRSVLEPGRFFPGRGVFFYYVSPFGRMEKGLPEQIDANEPVMFAHAVREEGRTLVSAIDGKSLDVRITGTGKVNVSLSADRRFVTLVPEEAWTGPEGGKVEIRLSCRLFTRLLRFGLKFFLGRRTHRFDGRFRFRVPPVSGLSKQARDRLCAPQKAGQPSTVFEIQRLSCPSPSLLPSYNQIGFDSLHYLACVVEANQSRCILWTVPGRLDEIKGKTLVEPRLKDVFVLTMDCGNDLVTLKNYDRFELSFMGSWDMPFGRFRLASRVDPESGNFLKKAALNAVVHCDDIRFYGRFLKLLGVSDMKTGLMHICGGADLDVWDRRVHNEPGIQGPIRVGMGPGMVWARFENPCLAAADHVFGILVVRKETGTPVAANHARRTFVEADPEGRAARIRLEVPGILDEGPLRAHVMVDTYCVFSGELA